MRARVRKILSSLALASSLGLGACLEIPASLHPLFPEAGEALEGIEGFWQEPDGTTGLDIRAAGPGVYDLVVCEKGAPSSDSDSMEVRFGYVGADLYWELKPKGTKSGSRLGLLPVHMQARIRFDENELEIAFLDGDALASALESGALTLSHSLVDDSVLVTASGEELRAFLQEHGGSEELFGETMRFQRR
jgi:hypothetical protein